MPNALTLETMSPGLLKVVERAKTEPEGRFHSLVRISRHRERQDRRMVNAKIGAS